MSTIICFILCYSHRRNSTNPLKLMQIVEQVGTTTDLTRIADKEGADKVTYIIYGATNALLFHLKCIKIRVSLGWWRFVVLSGSISALHRYLFFR
ncbi:hypothetical protein PUN28_017405 [Cardiocondyla obscurior]|uniref:Uncharacterized protein n=1 Tax=Cardiocondyla obscurior TaxID=286306 RepID=A0AAW2ENB5_9HYME